MPWIGLPSSFSKTKAATPWSSVLRCLLLEGGMLMSPEAPGRNAGEVLPIRSDRRERRGNGVALIPEKNGLP